MQRFGLLANGVNARQRFVSMTQNPNVASVFNNRASALKELKRLDEALASYDKAIALKPDYAEGFMLKAIDREQPLRIILSAHSRWPTVERRLTEVVAAYGINWLQNNSGHQEGSVHATISRTGLVKLFRTYLKIV
jgi:tetratricopeptide (TPR) repeat protein